MTGVVFPNSHQAGIIENVAGTMISVMSRQGNAGLYFYARPAPVICPTRATAKFFRKVFGSDLSGEIKWLAI